MIAIVATIGPMEFSEKAERQSESVATVNKAKNATQNPKPKRHKISASGRMTKPSLFKTIKSPVPNTKCETTIDKNPSHKVNNKVYIAPAMNFESTICVREMGFVANIRMVPIAASPEIKSPVTNATNNGICTTNICKMMKAIKFPFTNFPLNESVCSKLAVTKETIDSPSAFMAKIMMHINNVNAPNPK